MPKHIPVKLALPAIVEVDDYHDFDWMKGFVNKIVGRGHVEVIELGFSGGVYVGLAYERGAKPTKSNIKFLLNKKKITLDD